MNTNSCEYRYIVRVCSLGEQEILVSTVYHITVEAAMKCTQRWNELCAVSTSYLTTRNGSRYNTSTRTDITIPTTPDANPIVLQKFASCSSPGLYGTDTKAILRGGTDYSRI